MSWIKPWGNNLSLFILSLGHKSHLPAYRWAASLKGRHLSLIQSAVTETRGSQVLLAIQQEDEQGRPYFGICWKIRILGNTEPTFPQATGGRSPPLHCSLRNRKFLAALTTFNPEILYSSGFLYTENIVDWLGPHWTDNLETSWECISFIHRFDF